jgi:hypothetical protein
MDLVLSAGESGLGLPNQPSLKLQKNFKTHVIMSWLFVLAVSSWHTGAF